MMVSLPFHSSVLGKERVLLPVSPASGELRPSSDLLGYPPPTAYTHTHTQIKIISKSKYFFKKNLKPRHPRLPPMFSLEQMGNSHFPKSRWPASSGLVTHTTELDPLHSPLRVPQCPAQSLSYSMLHFTLRVAGPRVLG